MKKSQFHTTLPNFVEKFLLVQKWWPFSQNCSIFEVNSIILYANTVYQEWRVTAQFTRPQSSGLLYLGHYAREVREAHSKANQAEQAESSTARNLGWTASAHSPEGCSLFPQEAASVRQIWWWPLRAPTLIAKLTVNINGPFQGQQMQWKQWKKSYVLMQNNFFNRRRIFFLYRLYGYRT